MELWRTIANFIMAFSLLVMASYASLSYKLEKAYLECPLPGVQQEKPKDNTRYYGA